MLSLQGDLEKMVTNYLSNTSQMHLIFLKLFLWWVIKRIMTTSSICRDGNKVKSLVCNEKQDGSLYGLCIWITLYYITFFIVLPTVISIYVSLICIWFFFFCCSSGPILHQGSLNFNFIKSKNHVSWSWTFSGKPLNLLWYILSKLFRVLMSSNFWTHLVFL